MLLVWPTAWLYRRSKLQSSGCYSKGHLHHDSMPGSTAFEQFHSPRGDSELKLLLTLQDIDL
jgi:hypothetical protein